MKPILIPKPHAETALFTVDVFCRVIDNFGDAGVCLRLARQLVLEYGCRVRLFCDDVPLLHRLEPVPPLGLEYAAWQAHAAAQPAQGVVCGFGCELEPAYLHAMAAMPQPPRWLHVDYLSAEDWVEGTHGLDSRHPRLPLVQRFCSPGFTPATGGLLREQNCAPPWSEAQSLRTLAQHGIAPAADALRLLVFAYAYADFAPFIAASQCCGQPVHWLLCYGAAGDVLEKNLGSTATVSRLPFVPQAQFDALLRSAHRIWVRGEDSALRALWAGVPSVWQFYAQDEKLHLVKLQAYLQRMASALPDDDLSAVQQAHLAANQALSPLAAQTAWAHWLSGGDALNRSAQAWRSHLHECVPSLAQTVAGHVTPPLPA